jgi:hypothetical protein
MVKILPVSEISMPERKARDRQRKKDIERAVTGLKSGDQLKSGSPPSPYKPPVDSC